MKLMNPDLDPDQDPTYGKLFKIILKVKVRKNHHSTVLHDLRPKI